MVMVIKFRMVVSLNMSLVPIILGVFKWIGLVGMEQHRFRNAAWVVTNHSGTGCAMVLDQFGTAYPKQPKPLSPIGCKLKI